MVLFSGEVKVSWEIVQGRKFHGEPGLSSLVQLVLKRMGGRGYVQILFDLMKSLVSDWLNPWILFPLIGWRNWSLDPISNLVGNICFQVNLFNKSCMRRRDLEFWNAFGGDAVLYIGNTTVHIQFNPTEDLIFLLNYFLFYYFLNEKYSIF